ncbi:glutamine amidotransferase class-II [Anaeromyxobacter dehalogenans 2CP-1]|uniref:Glutamine amidotransferase class-II n=1 Tax=Anaeromyxobacter dehalogenans (strain ATCC BAA-258 / DSM 21875 / 2CP-1) TaxID=455488 RepID=B8JBG1_ANAD2|nr:class II glutamine amidotransferase [Anaeromyxobacter dehalogenans]ACL65788.1 glutamine amidotransferase class-II [Anaeromyxobacter dehalogenans 2CP-1]
MCRLFGQHAHPGRDACEPLCSAENALRFQSHRHPHGWGIAWYVQGSPLVRRGILPAHADAAFVEAGREIRSAVVVAHVREASVGPVLRENTHPFVHDRWVFAHNGTVARFKDAPDVRERILAEIDPDLRGRIRGDTDSERCFYLFLTRLRARGGLEAPGVEAVRAALAATTDAVLRIADAVPSPKPSSLTFLVSDGRLLAACRRGRTLHAASDAGPRHAFVVASERIGRAPWSEVPEGGFVATEDGIRVVDAPLHAP